VGISLNVETVVPSLGESVKRNDLTIHEAVNVLVAIRGSHAFYDVVPNLDCHARRHGRGTGLVKRALENMSRKTVIDCLRHHPETPLVVV